MKQFSLLFWGVFLTISAFSQSIVYVTPAGAGTKSGSSWANALSGVQLPNRVATADSGTQFWIAAGTYKPTTTTDRMASFSIASGVSVYGGFAGTETDLGQRSISVNETIFSGDIGTIGYYQDNCIHVILLRNVNNTIIINGLTIRDGHRTIYDYDASGAGIYIDLTADSLTVNISNCLLSNNIIEGSLTGGGGIGIFNKAKSICNLKLKNCHLTGNESDNGGAFAASVQSGSVNTIIEECLFSYNKGNTNSGAIAYDYTSPTSSIIIKKSQFIQNNALFWGGAISVGIGLCELDACSFIGNSVTSIPFYNWQYGGGGAILGGGTKSIFTNCLFVNNSAPNGGVIYSNSQTGESIQRFANCTFANNQARVVGGVFCNLQFDQPNAPTTTNPNKTYIDNCIIWQNTAPDAPVYKSQLWISPESDQIFNTLTATYSLIQNGYPGTGNLNADPLFVDAANGNFSLQPISPAVNAGSPDISDLLPTDIAGNPRIQGSRVDIGAYEFMGCSVCLPFTISRIH